MSTSRSNCSVIELLPSVLIEVICARPGISPNWRSSGWYGGGDDLRAGAGKRGRDLDGGKSTCGSGATGRRKRPPHRVTSRPAISSEVPIGCLMNQAETDVPREKTGASAIAVIASAGGSAATTRVPGARRYWPRVTTRVPVASPRSMTAIPSAIGPVATGTAETVASGATMKTKTPSGPRWMASAGTVSASFSVASLTCRSTNWPGQSRS